ncbi:MAG: hypothetical protein K6G56_09505 [Clostridiales bacterium]|nr:hypothetical protein [Clostridiales bacterium]
MKKLIAVILIFAALFALAGCYGVNVLDKPGIVFRSEKPVGSDLQLQTFPPEIKDPEVQDLLGGAVVDWDVITTGKTIPGGGARSIYPSYEEFKKAYGEGVEKLGKKGMFESFEKGTDVFVVTISFTVNTGGYTFGVADAAVKDGVITVNVTKTAPSPDAYVTQAFVTHNLVIAFDAKLYSEDLQISVNVNGEPYNFIGGGEEI